jgi:MFS family permease
MVNTPHISEDLLPDRAAIAAVVLGITAFAVSQGLTYPLISLVLEKRNVPAGLIGLNAAGFAAGLAAATLVIGPLTAFMRGDRLIVAGLVACALALSAFWLVDALWVWFAARFVLGFGASVVFIMSEAWLNAACPDRLRGRVSGLYGAGMCAGFAAGPLAIPVFGTGNGFGFAALAVYLSLVAFLAAILGRRARTRPEPSPAGALWRFFRSTPVLVCMVVAFGFADIAAISAMPVYFVRTGHSEAFAAISVTVLALPTALAQPVVGVLLDRLPRRRIAIWAGVVAAAGFLVLPLLSSEPAILVSFAIMGAASFALYTCALTLLGEDYSGGLLVAGSAVFSLAYAIGSAAGSAATGYAMEVATPAAGPILAGGVLAGFAALFAAGLRRSPPRPAED